MRHAILSALFVLFLCVPVYALENDISGAKEGSVGLNNKVEIERELRELDRDITRIERGL